MRRLLFVLLLIPAAHADEEDLQRFLTIAGADKAYHGQDAQTFAKSALPPAITEMLNGTWSTTGRPFPNSFTGYSLDLNKDGKKEYFIQTPLGGSGGPHYILFTEIEGKWQQIMDFQGGFYTIKHKSGAWPRLVTYSRGGAGHYAKQYWRHDNGAYHLTAIDRHRPPRARHRKQRQTLTRPPSPQAELVQAE